MRVGSALGVVGVVGGACVVAACGSGDAPPAATVRDSAGVAIVENPASRADVPLSWSLATEPMVSIGVLDGAEEYQLYRVVDALRLDDGRLAVVNGGTNEVRFYDPSGVFLGRWGGNGDGPGEFRAANRIERWSGDSLAVWDQRLRRLTVFAPNGTVGRAWVLPSAGDMKSPVLDGVLDDGSLVVTATDFSALPPENGLQRLPVEVGVTTADGDLLGSMGSFPGRETVIRMSSDAINIYRLPFARNLVVEAAGRHVLVASTDHMEMDLWRPDGSLSRIVRVDRPPRLLTDAEFDAALEHEAAQVPEERRAALRKTWPELPRSDTLPAFYAVVVDAVGDFWVEPYRLPQTRGPVDWMVLDPEGRALGRVTLPEGLRVFEIGRDYILGLARDELDVEHVQVWPLRRGGG